MMDALLQFDQQFLLFLNSLHTPLWDNFFWIFTSVSIWIPFYITLLYVIFNNQGKRGFLILLAIVLLVTLCDQISTNIFKEGFERLRPSHEPQLEGLVHLVNQKHGGLYGFVSSHATNSFGIALFTSLLFRYRWYTIFIMLWAAVNSYSRIYLGLHYPGDILGGAVLGLSLGWLVFALYEKVKVRYLKGAVQFNSSEMSMEFSRSTVAFLMWVGGVMLITIYLCAKLLTGLI
jgi:undecaprenyl-diphosphatase